MSYQSKWGLSASNWGREGVLATSHWGGKNMCQKITSYRAEGLSAGGGNRTVGHSLSGADC